MQPQTAEQPLVFDVGKQWSEKDDRAERTRENELKEGEVPVKQFDRDIGANGERIAHHEERNGTVYCSTSHDVYLNPRANRAV